MECDTLAKPLAIRLFRKRTDKVRLPRILTLEKSRVIVVTRGICRCCGKNASSILRCMKDHESPTLVIYVTTLNPGAIGIAKEILSVEGQLRDQGFEPTYRQADLARSILDVGRNAFPRVHAVIFDGIVLGFRYGTLLNMISSLPFLQVFLIWHEYRWVYPRLMRERPLRGRIFRRLIRSRRINHLVYSERTQRFLESLGVPRNTIHIIGGCLTQSQLAESEVPTFSGTDRIRVMAAASIQARKGTDIFCEAAINVCERLSHVDFYWFGAPLNFEPGFSESCVDMVRRSGFEDRIQFWGLVERADIHISGV